MDILVAEIVGTAILIVIGCGVNANVSLGRTNGHGSGWIVITTGWGLAVAMGAYAVGRLSGAHLNPAVTLGLWSIGEVETAKLLPYIAGEMIGAFLGAVIVWVAYKNHFDATSDPDAKLGTFSTAPSIPNTPWNFATEFIGTFVLMFGILAIGANAGEMTNGDFDLSSVFSSGINPLLVGFLVWAIGLAIGGPTGYAINPARDLGPRIAHAILPIPAKRDSNWGYAWLPVVAPIAGGVAGAMVFQMLGF